jgi:hypothetical protein
MTPGIRFAHMRVYSYSKNGLLNERGAKVLPLVVVFDSLWRDRNDLMQYEHSLWIHLC